MAGGQRLLNTAVFAPSGALLVLVARAGEVRVGHRAVGFALLAAYSVAIEYTQLALARLDRACDVTDMIDNVTGAAIGVLIGIALRRPSGRGGCDDGAMSRPVRPGRY